MTVVLLDGWMAEVRRYERTCRSLLALADLLDRHVRSDALRVQKYHGSSKEIDIAKLLDFDIVLTTYATITAEFSRDSCLHGITWFRIVLDEGRPYVTQVSLS
jgi:SWI/SNF-related matrix-associated actin-dependent regulator of chromatin subfamily A3